MKCSFAHEVLTIQFDGDGLHGTLSILIDEPKASLFHAEVSW
jgi:hypothetical protein